MEIPLCYRLVSGLDPALPLFMSGDSNTHLSAGDAKFVGMTFLSFCAAANRYDHVFLSVNRRCDTYGRRIFRHSLGFGSRRFLPEQRSRPPAGLCARRTVEKQFSRHCR